MKKFSTAKDNDDNEKPGITKQGPTGTRLGGHIWSGGRGGGGGGGCWWFYADYCYVVVIDDVSDSVTVSRGQHPTHQDPVMLPEVLPLQLVDLVMDFVFGLSSLVRVK